MVDNKIPLLRTYSKDVIGCMDNIHSSTTYNTRKKP